MNGSILIVDDEDTLRLTLKSRLLSKGFEVDVAADGEEALEKLKEREFDILLLDINMPRLNGIQVLHFVTETYPNTEVIMLTGFADFTTAIECLKSGAKDYLVKPIDTTELITRLNAILRARASERALQECVEERLSTSGYELLGPLNTIGSIIQHLTKSPHPKASKANDELLRYARELSRGMLKKIRNSIILSKLSSDMVHLNRQKVDLSGFVESVCDRYAVLAKSEGLKFQKKVEGKLSALKFDPEKIEQVLNNLLELALQHPSKRSVITLRVSAETVRPSEMEEFKGVVFAVEGMGTKIKKDQITELFEKRNGKPPKSSVEMQATLLGLVISRNMIEAHGGKIWAEEDNVRDIAIIFALPRS